MCQSPHTQHINTLISLIYKNFFFVSFFFIIYIFIKLKLYTNCTYKLYIQVIHTNYTYKLYLHYTYIQIPLLCRVTAGTRHMKGSTVDMQNPNAVPPSPILKPMKKTP